MIQAFLPAVKTWNHASVGVFARHALLRLILLGLMAGMLLGLDIWFGSSDIVMNLSIFFRECTPFDCCCTSPYQTRQTFR